MTSGNRAKRWCSRSSTVIAGGARAPSTFAMTTAGAVGVGRAQRVVQHRPQVLLELRRARALDRPVPRVVRAHGQLVDHDLARGQSRTAPPRAARSRRARRRCAAPAPARPRRASAVSPGAGASTSTHWPSACTVSTTGHAAAWPNGERATSAASSRRIGTRSSAISGVPAASSSATSSGVGVEPHAAPVVAAADGLEHRRHRPRRTRRGRRGVVISANRGPAMPSSASRRRITSLSWACRSASGAGVHGHPVGDQRAQVLLRHLLVVEGDGRAAARERPQRREVGRRARARRPG